MAFLDPLPRAVTIQDLVANGYEYISLIRTSTTEQAKSIDQQVEEVQNRMTAIGFGDPVFTEIGNVSGAKEDREQMQAIFDFIEARPANQRNLVLVVRDPARFSRFTRQGLDDQERLEELGVYLYFSNLNLLIGGKGIEQGNARLIFQILLTIQTYAKFDETIASQKGRKKSKREKGIQGGTGRDTFRENVPKSGKQKGKSIFRRIAASIDGLEAGTITVKGLARELSNSTRKVYPRMVREIRKEIEDVIAKVGKKGLEVWLNVWDELIRYEGFRSVGRISKPPRGTKSGTFRQSERARALWRVAQGFINDPSKWQDPVNTGNPEVATFSAPENTGTLEHAYRNPLTYLPAAR